MAVRFRRSGTTEIKDHNELINRGTRTHAEIDTYLAEMDAARGSQGVLKMFHRPSHLRCVAHKRAARGGLDPAAGMMVWCS